MNKNSKSWAQIVPMGKNGVFAIQLLKDNADGRAWVDYQKGKKVWKGTRKEANELIDKMGWALLGLP